LEASHALSTEIVLFLLSCRHPLPPDTPEHGAALQHFFKVAEEQLIVEAGGALARESLLAVVLKDYKDFLTSQLNLQLAVPGHELLELLCQLMDGEQQQQQQHGSGDGSSSSSSGGGGGKESPAKGLQLRAVRTLLQQSQPELPHCPQLRERTGSDSSSSSGSGGGAVNPRDVIQGCLHASLEVLRDQDVSRFMKGDGISWETPSELAAAVLKIAGAAGNTIAAQPQQESSVYRKYRQPVDVFAEQLRVLGGALVLQFVSAARAAGGPAWQQEVPLQAVVLFGALEQMQGMALAAVQQQDVRQGVQDAQKAAAAAAAAEQQQQREREAVPRSKRGSIAISIEDSSSEECDDEQQQQQQDVQDACAAVAEASNSDNNNSVEGDEQQQQQQQAAHADRLQPLVQKVTDIIHLIRQFADLNAAVNSSSSSSSSSATAPASSTTNNGSSSSSGRALSCEALFSPGGPVAALHPEPATLGGWSQPAAAAAAAVGAAAAAVNRAGCCPGLRGNANSAAPDTSMGAGTATVQQQQQQHLYRDAIAGASVLFNVQEVAMRGPIAQALHSSLSDWHSSLDVCPAFPRQYRAMRQVAERVREAAQNSGITAEINTRHLMCALSFGRQRLERLRQQLAQQLQQLSMGVDPSWRTLHDVGAAAGAVSSDSDDDEFGAAADDEKQQGSGLGARLGLWTAQQAVQDDVAAAIKAGGSSIRCVLG
jgi:hypothetical protein